MKKPGQLFFHILTFIIAQLAWFELLALWIYWYVTNYILLNRVEQQVGIQFISDATNVAPLVGGLVLLVMLSLSITLIFIYLNRQVNITRMYDNFISNVTHELKSPLSSIQLYLETMRKREVERSTQEEFIALMLKDVDRLGQLINSILYLSSMEKRRMARKVAHDYHVYPAGKVVSEVLDEVIKEFNFPAKHVSVSGSVSGRIVVDRNWLKIVFSNLVDNAIKYTIGQAELNITLSEDTQYFHVTVSDNGIGIDQRDLKVVFNKFQRLYNSESPNVKGTGLGLYWVREIIQYHGGKISAHSAGKNSGTSFRIRLPIYQSKKNRHINRLLRLSRKNKIPES